MPKRIASEALAISMAASVRAMCSQAFGGAVRAGAAARQAQPVAHRAAAAAVAAWRPLHDRRPFHVSRRARGMFDGLKQQVPGQRWLFACAPALRLPPALSGDSARGAGRFGALPRARRKVTRVA